MKTLPIAECYILPRHGDPIPVKVIKETASTVSVAYLDEAGEPRVNTVRTFQKQKIYRGGYENPRETLSSDILERGSLSRYYADHLTFRVEETRREFAEAQVQKALNQRAEQVKNRILAFFPRHSSHKFDNSPEAIAKLEALEKLFPASEGEKTS